MSCINLISFSFCLCEGKGNQFGDQYKLSVTILDFVLWMFFAAFKQQDINPAVFGMETVYSILQYILHIAYFFIEN